MFALLLIIGGLLLLLSLKKPKSNKKQYLEAYNRTQFVDNLSDQQAIDLSSLSDRTIMQKLLDYWNITRSRLGRAAELKLVAYIAFVVVAVSYLNDTFFKMSPLNFLVPSVCVSLVMLFSHLTKREKNEFEESFPDALNMLVGAVSAGESITQAIQFVGQKLSGKVGQEFALMGERLKLGESPDEVFRKSCRRFPYPSFSFFVITLRANMIRGGQLKDVLSRLNRLMFLNRAAEKKKMALTSEARISAKIVCAMPFIFLVILKYLNPDNFDFVMFDERGRPILYYVIGSEAIGMLIIWSLMKGVRI